MRRISQFTRLVLIVIFSFIIMLETSADVSRPKQKNAFPHGPIITPFFGKYWMLVSDLIYKIKGSTDQIVVPAGFVTDLASIPNSLKGIFDKMGRYAPAGIIHDYLYWEKTCTQNQADRVLKQALIETGVSKKTAKIIKMGVKIAKNLRGNIPWKNNSKERKKHYPRVIPLEYRDFPVGIKWKEYQTFLFKKGIKSKSTNSQPAIIGVRIFMHHLIRY